MELRSAAPPGDAEPLEILIGDRGGSHVAIRLPHAVCPGAQDLCDEGWVECDVSVSAGGFRARYQASFRFDEFEAFRAQLLPLAELLRGEASFATMEEQLNLTLAGDGRGHIAVEGSAGDEPGGSNRLVFMFQIDQTYLREIVISLDRILDGGRHHGP